MDIIELPLTLLSIFLLVLTIFLIFCLKKGSQTIEKLQAKTEGLQREKQECELIISRLETELHSSKENLASEKRAFMENREQLKDTFKSLASEALEGNNRQFIAFAKQILEKENLQGKNDLDKKQAAIGELIKPLSMSLENYQRQVEEMEKSRQRSYSLVENEIKRNSEINTQLSRETVALKDALKKPHVRGRWGEVQLKNCIDMAGISDYSDIQMQDTHIGDEEKRLIPDMTVKMPGGHLIIVDAKTPIDAFITYLDAKDDEEKKNQITRHSQQVKKHIKKLAAKEYQSQIKGSADFTVMFLPNESFLYAALEGEPNIMEYALEQKVLIATPPTLIGLLRVIRYGWNEQKLTKNAEKISEMGKELHKRVSDFLLAYTNVGKHLDKAMDEYDVGLKRLNNRVLVCAKRLEDLGTKSAKGSLL